MTTTNEGILQAIDLAQLAVIADKSHDYDNAIKLYTDSIELIEGQLLGIDTPNQKVLTSYVFP